MNEPPDKTNRVKKKFAYTTQPTTCAVNTTSSTHHSNHEVVTVKKEGRAYAPHTLRHACREHTQEMDSRYITRQAREHFVFREKKQLLHDQLRQKENLQPLKTQC